MVSQVGFDGYVQTATSSSFLLRKSKTMAQVKKCFEQFRVASGLNDEAGEKQVSTLLYAIGEDVEDTLTSMNPSADWSKDFGKVIKKFDDFLKVRKNIIFKRARFN
uniref:Uncharacterized protein n=1 Tax=Amphimedon queenslandica TaxID=400682 RepID=A0A1X7VHF5_AMPQE